MIGCLLACLLVASSFAQEVGRRQPTTRRTQRVVPMDEVHVLSPDGKVTFTVGSNPERMTYWVTLDHETVIEPSRLNIRMDGYHLSSGVIFRNLDRYTIDETFPWHGVHSTAVNRSNGAKISLTHDLSMTPYVLDIRVFNDGVAYRHVIDGSADDVRNRTSIRSFSSRQAVRSGTTTWTGTTKPNTTSRTFATFRPASGQHPL